MKSTDFVLLVVTRARPDCERGNENMEEVVGKHHLYAFTAMVVITCRYQQSAPSESVIYYNISRFENTTGAIINNC